MLLNSVVEEDSWESLGMQGDQTVNPEGNQSWIFIGRTDAEAETPILWPPAAKNWLIGKDPDAGTDWRQEEKGTDRGWDAWMASLMQWTWVWAGSGSWWWTGKPGVLQSMGSQRVRHDWATELNWALGSILALLGFFSNLLMLNFCSKCFVSESVLSLKQIKWFLCLKQNQT